MPEPLFLSAPSALSVIAASRALPIIEAQLEAISRQRPTGNSAGAMERHRELDEQARPLRERRQQLLGIVNGQGDTEAPDTPLAQDNELVARIEAQLRATEEAWIKDNGEQGYAIYWELLAQVAAEVSRTEAAHG